jgi:hypothetical protein
VRDGIAEHHAKQSPIFSASPLAALLLSGLALALLHAHTAIVAGTPLGAGFTNPHGVAVDSSGNIYVADAVLNAVFKMPAGLRVAELCHDAERGIQLSNGRGCGHERQPFHRRCREQPGEGNALRLYYL